MEKLVEYCKRGVAEGAKLVCGGKQVWATGGKERDGEGRGGDWKVDRPGLFFEPTIFTEVEDANFIAVEESFGPVMIISKFSDELGAPAFPASELRQVVGGQGRGGGAEAGECERVRPRVRRLLQGAATCWTGGRIEEGRWMSQDVSRVLAVAERLEAGTVFVNCYNKTDVAAPFGGFKQSGFGKDLGSLTTHTSATLSPAHSQLPSFQARRRSMSTSASRPSPLNIEKSRVTDMAPGAQLPTQYC